MPDNETMSEDKETKKSPQFQIALPGYYRNLVESHKKPFESSGAFVRRCVDYVCMKQDLETKEEPKLSLDDVIAYARGLK